MDFDKNTTKLFLLSVECSFIAIDYRLLDLLLDYLLYDVGECMGEWGGGGGLSAHTL